MLVLLKLLRWPDWSLADHFVEDFRVTGVVPASNLFPRIKRDQGLTEGGLLGEEADAWNTLLSQDESSDPYADVIFEHTEKERLK
eukprot:6231961-Heterocapsa_arctica.AAC.1